MPDRADEPTFVKSSRDERLWQVAKDQATKRGLAASSEEFYRYANATLQHMRLRTGRKDYRPKLRREQRRVGAGGERYESIAEMLVAVRGGRTAADVLTAVVGTT